METPSNDQRQVDRQAAATRRTNRIVTVAVGLPLLAAALMLGMVVFGVRPRAAEPNAMLMSCPACGGPLARIAAECPKCGYSPAVAERLDREQREMEAAGDAMQEEWNRRSDAAAAEYMAKLAAERKASDAALQADKSDEPE